LESRETQNKTNGRESLDNHRKTLIIKNLRNVPGHHLLAEFLQVLIAVRDKKKGTRDGIRF